MRDRVGAPEKLTRLLGGLSIASGLALVCTPELAARAYALPRRPELLRALGLRDVCVGLALLAPPTAPLGCTLRSWADALDAGLIANERVHGRRGAFEAGTRVAGALALSALALRLRSRITGEIEHEPDHR